MPPITRTRRRVTSVGILLATALALITLPVDALPARHEWVLSVEKIDPADYAARYLPR